MNLRATLWAYGTSEGVTKAWDTRGRGRKQAVNQQESPVQSTSRPVDPQGHNLDRLAHKMGINEINEDAAGREYFVLPRDTVLHHGSAGARPHATSPEDLAYEHPGAEDVYNGTYLTNKSGARYYARERVEERGSGTPTVHEVTIRKGRKLYADPIDEQSYFVRGSIPKKDVRRIE